MRNTLWILLILAGVMVLPFIFRRSGEALAPAGESLVVVSSHNESVRYEFERGFRQWYRARHGREVSIDWRSLGGTSEIMRYIRSTYT
ncbi:MAG: hypothetical protein J6S21_00405, partial [Victivallales bacterium]|nr:hypothetical protein [Victivallales bacterium]